MAAIDKRMMGLLKLFSVRSVDINRRVINQGNDTLYDLFYGLQTYGISVGYLAAVSYFCWIISSTYDMSHRTYFAYLIRTFFVFVIVVSGNFAQAANQFIPAADHPTSYLPLLKGKRVGLVVNHSSTYRDSIHLVDFLLSKGIRVERIFAPEHGYLGKAGAGEKVEDSKDEQRQIPIVSLYGKKKKPSLEDMQGLDVVLFDIQDVGVRFYTYISTLTYVMDRAGEAGVPVIILDRPNPHRHYIDGPVLDTARFKSFVGLHPVPVVYGLTIGEYGAMVNGEGWIKHPCKLQVVYCKNYNPQERYRLPIPPSPNLPNHNAILLYPSLCFFEGAPVSVGRGTDKPFQIIGAPWFPFGDFYFTPKPREGAPQPLFADRRCRGYDLTNFAEDFLEDEPQLHLGWLISAYNAYKQTSNTAPFFRPFFDLLAGTDELRKSIEAGKDEGLISQEWLPQIARYTTIRAKYSHYD